jgi:hypothetical protein
MPAIELRGFPRERTQRLWEIQVPHRGHLAGACSSSRTISERDIEKSKVDSDRVIGETCSSLQYCLMMLALRATEYCTDDCLDEAVITANNALFVTTIVYEAPTRYCWSNLLQ